MAGITVHRFESTGEAYDRSQTGYFPALQIVDESLWLPMEEVEVKDGDLLYVPSEGVVGIMIAAWPYAITYDVGKFHRAPDNWDWRAVEVPSGDTRDYGASFRAAWLISHPELLVYRGLRRFLERLGAPGKKLPV